jgi:hypothetical protein
MIVVQCVKVVYQRMLKKHYNGLIFKISKCIILYFNVPYPKVKFGTLVLKFIFGKIPFWQMPYFANILQDSLFYLTKNNFSKKTIFRKFWHLFFHYFWPNLTLGYTISNMF